MIDSYNKFMVSSQGDRVVILRSASSLNKDEALNLAAWLFIMSGKSYSEFELMVREVEQ